MLPNPGNSIADTEDQKITCPDCQGSGVMGLASLVKYLRVKGIEDEATLIDSLDIIAFGGDCPCIECGGEGEITKTI